MRCKNASVMPLTGTFLAPVARGFWLMHLASATDAFFANLPLTNIFDCLPL
jgi:hypothetical protein